MKILKLNSNGVPEEISFGDLANLILTGPSDCCPEEPFTILFDENGNVLTGE